jgi:hypothetical protein
MNGKAAKEPEMASREAAEGFGQKGTNGANSAKRPAKRARMAAS